MLTKEVRVEISADPPSPAEGLIISFKCCGLRPVGPPADPHHGNERIAQWIDGARIASIKRIRVIHVVLACVNAQSNCGNLWLHTGKS